jgi:adenylate cyclase
LSAVTTDPNIGADARAHEVIRWILTDGPPSPSPARFLSMLCARLLEAGVPLWRVSIFVATLHPQYRAFGWRWRRDLRASDEVRIAQGVEQTDEYRLSPLRTTIEQGTVRRFRLDHPNDEFPLLEELRAEGCTDYLAAPLNRLGPRYPSVSWTTDRAGGFSDDDIALLEAIRPALAAVMEAITVRRTARGLFAIYHGQHVGERVFDGNVRRGEFDIVRTAIMATDLRGFTGISDQLPGEDVIEALDDYFEHVALATHGAQGHILKFIGDGVLAVFGIDGGDDHAAAAAALRAARDIVRRLAAHNAAGGESGRVELRAGIGLHIGDVMYGNVGSADRLDFTAIGPAVNLAFRLEGLTKTLKRPVLASRAFAEAAETQLTSLGPHPIRGLSGDEDVFGLPEHDR